MHFYFLLMADTLLLSLLHKEMNHRDVEELRLNINKENERKDLKLFKKVFAKMLLVLLLIIFKY